MKASADMACSSSSLRLRFNWRQLHCSSHSVRKQALVSRLLIDVKKIVGLEKETARDLVSCHRLVPWCVLWLAFIVFCMFDCQAAWVPLAWFWPVGPGTHDTGQSCLQASACDTRSLLLQCKCTHMYSGGSSSSINQSVNILTSYWPMLLFFSTYYFHSAFF